MSLLASPPEGDSSSYLNARSALVYLLKMATAEGILDPEAGPRTPEQIAASRGSDPGRIMVLCDSLVNYGILNRFGDAFMVSDRFRTIIPAEALGDLPRILDAEEERLKEMEKSGKFDGPTAGLPPVSPSLLRPAQWAKPRNVAAPTNGKAASANGGKTPANGRAASNGAAIDRISGLARAGVADTRTRNLPADLALKTAPSAALDASSASTAIDLLMPEALPPIGAPVRKRRRGNSGDVGEEVWAKVSSPSAFRSVRQEERSPIHPAAVSSAFVKNWPIGPQSGKAIDATVRKVAGLKPVEKRRLRYHLGTFLWLLAAVCILWAAWDLWGTGIGQAAAQKDLKADFAKAVAAPASDDPAVPDSVPGDAPAPVAFRDMPPAPLPGSAVALLKIPSLGVEQVVLEGTGVPDLKRGPGHYPGTPLPGQPGNAAIAGHRTTYGAPFFKLGKISVGDDIKVETRAGEFLYRVSRVFRVDPSDSSPLLSTTENQLTLTTCDPPFSAAKRLIVVATLIGEPDRTTPTVAPQSIPVPAPEAQPEESVSPALDLRAIKQPGAAKPSPAAAAAPKSSPSPAGAAASPAPSPAAKTSPAPAASASPAAPVSNNPQAPTAPPATAPPATTPTTRPPAPTTQPPAPAGDNPFLNPQTQDTVPPVSGGGGPLNQGTCSDGIDNDHDGKTDLADKASCHGDPSDDE